MAKRTNVIQDCSPLGGVNYDAWMTRVFMMRMANFSIPPD
jgi:hypothetical protein